jgi:hypothetical protein
MKNSVANEVRKTTLNQMYGNVGNYIYFVDQKTPTSPIVVYKSTRVGDLEVYNEVHEEFATSDDYWKSGYSGKLLGAIYL